MMMCNLRLESWRMEGLLILRKQQSFNDIHCYFFDRELNHHLFFKDVNLSWNLI